MSNIDLFAALSLSRWYAQHPWSIDGLVYLVLFTGLAQVALGKRFTGRAGAAVCGTVGLALAVGAATFAERYDFSLGQLGPLAWVVLLLLLAVVFYQLSRALGVGRWTAVGVAAVVLTVALANTGAAALLDAAGISPLVHAATVIAVLVTVGGLAGSRFVGTKHSGEHHLGLVHGAVHHTHPPAVPSISREPVWLPGQLRLILEGVSKRGIDGATVPSIEQVASTPRPLDERCLEVLAALAKQRRMHDPAAVKLLVAASENLNSFDRAAALARQAAQAGHTDLCVQLLTRLLSLEEQAEQLSVALAQNLGH